MRPQNQSCRIFKTVYMLGVVLCTAPSWGGTLDCDKLLSARADSAQSQNVLVELAFGTPEIHVSDQAAHDRSLLQLGLRTKHDFGIHSLTISALREKRGRWSDAGGEAFEQLSKRDVAFVTGIYEARRQNWPASFIAKLRAMQNEYLDNSTYIDQDIDGQMIASVRLIRENHGHLPMEHYLGLNIKVPLGTVKIEPGNYAIKKEFTELGSIATSVGMLAETNLVSGGVFQPFFATYADKYSQLLYGQMGFKFVTPDMIENWREIGPQATVDPKTGAINIRKIEYDSGGNAITLNWTPMYATHEMFVAMLEERFFRIGQKRGGAAMSAAIQRLRQKIESTLKSPANKFVGPLVSSKLFGRIEISPLGLGTAAILVFGPSPDGLGEELREQVQVPWPLPKRLDVEFESGLGNAHLSFYGGKMRVTRTKPVTSVTEIDFTVDYTAPKHLLFERTEVRNICERFEVDFGF